MRTRVRPTGSCLGQWAVDIFNPHEGCTNNDRCVELQTYHFFWYANWRANRLAKGSLEEVFCKKERFLNRLRFGDESNE